LIYSHDSFGLGHLRRCRTLAHALVERNRNLSVLILTGSPIVGSFDFRARVDFVRVPGVIKLRNGEYTSLSLHIDIENTIELRESIIRHTADSFDPDIFIVDKEPLGLRGEVTGTLEMLKARGTPLVLGLRDVMDEPAALAPEWARKNVTPALRHLYDQIWVYGLPEICDPMEDIALPADVRRKVVYTGYLKRNAPKAQKSKGMRPPFDEPYLLVTAGGGGDGEEMIDWVLRAYEHDRSAPNPALIVFGPFMKPESQAAFRARAERLPRVKTLTFDARLETLMAKAAGVVAMGGYNTFCEILSFDKPAIIVPRTKPRLEQYIRAQRAEQLGMVRMMASDGARNAGAMASALRALPGQTRPSEVVVPGLLDGLGNVDRLAGRLMGAEGRDVRRKVAV
jgi:predicted glycosyltransferase